VLFPSWIYLLWVALGLAPLLCVLLLARRGGALSAAGGDGAAAGAAPLQLADCALLLSACGAFSLLQYELLHAFSHRALPPWLQGRMQATGWFAGVMARHRRHHKRNDGLNYNITWPIADVLFGTLAPAERAAD